MQGEAQGSDLCATCSTPIVQYDGQWYHQSPHGTCQSAQSSLLLRSHGELVRENQELVRKNHELYAHVVELQAIGPHDEFVVAFVEQGNLINELKATIDRMQPFVEAVCNVYHRSPVDTADLLHALDATWETYRDEKANRA